MMLAAPVSTWRMARTTAGSRPDGTGYEVGWLFSDRRYAGQPAMPGLAAIVCVEAERTLQGRTSRSTRYYLCSAHLTPERFAAAVRAHWAIENSLHWVLDVTFDEDRARNRRDNGPENLAILRRLALNLLRTAARSFPSAASASAPDGPMPSHDPS